MSDAVKNWSPAPVPTYTFRVVWDATGNCINVTSIAERVIRQYGEALDQLGSEDECWPDTWKRVDRNL